MLLARLEATGELEALAGILQKVGPALAKARQSVFQSIGVEAHRRCAEVAIFAGCVVKDIA